MVELHEMEIIRQADEEKETSAYLSFDQSSVTSLFEDGEDSCVLTSDGNVEDIELGTDVAKDKSKFSWCPFNLNGKPKLLWCFAANEILMGSIVGLILVRFMWNSPLPGLMGNPYVARIKVWITLTRVLVQILTGIFIFFGLRSANWYVTARSLKEWFRGAYFVLFEQSLSLGLNIIVTSSAAANEPGGFHRIQDIWGNLLAIVYHVAVFILVRNYYVQNYT